MVQLQPIDFHPARKFFELCLWEHANRPKILAYPRFKKGALKYFKTQIEALLVGPIEVLTSDILKNKWHLAVLHPSIKSIPNGSFSILYDLQIREFVEVLSLLGHPASEIQRSLTTIPFLPPITEPAVSGYLHFFWNCDTKTGWTSQHTLALKAYLEKNPSFAKSFSRHLRLGFGTTTRLEVALDLGLDCPLDTILGELYRGFCQSVVSKNKAIARNDADEVEKWSKTLTRDMQVLKGLGFRSKGGRLVDKIQVIQSDP